MCLYRYMSKHWETYVGCRHIKNRYLYVKMKTFTQTYKIRVACSYASKRYPYSVIRIVSTFRSENRIRRNINMYSQMLPLTVMNPVEFVFSHEHTSHWLSDQQPIQGQVHMLLQTITLVLEMVPELVPMIDFVAERLLNILQIFFLYFVRQKRVTSIYRLFYIV